MTAGKRIALVRKEVGLSSKEFAAVFGMTQGNISQIENNKLRPSVEMLAEIYKKWRFSPEWLLTGEGNMFPDSVRVNKSAAVDNGLLHEIITCVEETCAEKGVRLVPKSKSKVITTFYDLFSGQAEEDGKKIVNISDYISKLITAHVDIEKMGSEEAT